MSEERDSTQNQRGRPFKPGNPGRRPGSKNKKTIVLERVYQRCAAKDFHPADVLMEIAQDPKVNVLVRRDCANDLLKFFEGQQPESKPHSPNTPEDAVKAAQDTMAKLAELSKPLAPQEPKA